VSEQVEGRVFELADHRRDDTEEIPVVSAVVDNIAPQPITRAEVRKDVLPTWAKSPAAAKDAAKWQAQHIGHGVTFHALRSPLYWWKLVTYAPRGFGRLVHPVGVWVWQADDHKILKAHGRALIATADPKDNYYDVRRSEADRLAYDARKLSRKRGVRRRASVVVLTTALLIFTGMVVAAWTTRLEQAAIVATLLAMLGVVGRNRDKPVVGAGAASTEKRPRLTTDVISAALSSIQIPRLSKAISDNPGAITYHSVPARTPTGWRADLDLPRGIVASDIADKRAELASALRRPLGCVFVEGDAGAHEGRLILTVLDKPLSEIKAAPWPLAKSGSINVFQPVAIGTDQLGRLIEVTLMRNSVLIGAKPQMGKSVILRLMLLACALDFRTELHVYNFKGGRDLAALREVSHRWRAGDGEDDVAALLADLRTIQTDMSRRYATMSRLPLERCPDGRITDELASDPGLGLRPVALGIDEVQVPITHPIHGKDIADVLTDLTKRGPACGVIVVLATQRPDKESLPKGISDNAGLRVCFRVMGHEANNMILGPGAFASGFKATLFTDSDKGVCWVAGHASAPSIVLISHVDGVTAAKVAERAWSARSAAGTLTGLAAGADPSPDTDVGSVLDHLAKVWPAGQGRVWFEVLAELLCDRYPAYEGWTVDRLSAAVKPHGLVACQIKRTVAGVPTNRWGLSRMDLHKAMGDRDDAPEGVAQR